MHSFLPVGIEASLKEAGFSAMEMLILRKLVEEYSVTVRELSFKTGKSVGALDQAMKKLLSKKIAKREVVNGQPRYSIHSLDAIVRYAKRDLEARKETLERRHQSFTQFIESLKIDKSRPDIEYFTGLEGIKAAYEKLLNYREEFLTMTPIVDSPEDDPLRAFRVDFFRRRQVRQIFQRVLAPDSAPSRRFQSRDPFEYRETLLLPEKELPLPFEKTVVNGTIACIDTKNETACFIRYPELAAAERATFESLWSRGLGIESKQSTQNFPRLPQKIPFKTKFLSSVREFVLSARSLAILLFLALLAGGLTFGLYQSNRELNLQRMRDKVMAIAATGALQIDARDLEVLQAESDYERPEWAKVVHQLEAIRMNNSDVLFAYILRKSDQVPSGIVFVADSHSINPYVNLDDDQTNDVDANHDGRIASEDYLQWPGQEYLTPPEEVFDAFQAVTATAKFYEDAWGRVITGYAPIKDEDGAATAVLAIDIHASKLSDLTGKTFFPIYSFLVLFLCFVIVRIVAQGSLKLPFSSRS